MTKRLLLAAVLVAAMASTALAAAGDPAVQRNGYWWNIASGVNRTNSTGATMTDDAARDRDSYLAPTLIYTGTIAYGAADTTSTVNLSAYKTVALLFQLTGPGTNQQLRFAVNARYNLGGASDSLSLFSIPCLPDTVASTGIAAARGTAPAAAACGSEEFPVSITNTQGPSFTGPTNSLPQGKVVYLTLPQGAAWPSSCSFRIRYIGRQAAGNTPTVRVWVMGTPL